MGTIKSSSLAVSPKKRHLISILKECNKKKVQLFKDKINNNLPELIKYETIFAKPKKVKSLYNGEWSNVKECEEMRELIEIFSTFDPINDLSKHCANYDGVIDESINNTTQDNYRGVVIVSYMKHPNFNANLLKTRRWDHVVNALITYILSSSISSLMWIKQKYPDCGNFIASVYDEKLAVNNTKTMHKALFIIESLKYEWIYTRTPFKFLSKHFQPSPEETMRNEFHIMDYLELSFIGELQEFHAKLLENNVDESFACMLESCKPIPHNIQHIIGNYNDICGKSNIRYFTGQACCGKTSLVEKINFLAKSRGSIGGFSKKADSIASASCLHFSIDFVLRQYENIIGVSCSS
uniref:EVC2 protein n=1 Tax=Fopius arisanus TaxID=64838 RepID=A0A0C9PK37_9HYME